MAGERHGNGILCVNRPLRTSEGPAHWKIVSSLGQWSFWVWLDLQRRCHENADPNLHGLPWYSWDRECAYKMRRQMFSSNCLNSEFKTSYIQTNFRILSHTSQPPEIYSYMNKGSSTLDIHSFIISPLQFSCFVIMGVMNWLTGN